MVDFFVIDDYIDKTYKVIWIKNDEILYWTVSFPVTYLNVKSVTLQQENILVKISSSRALMSINSHFTYDMS